jgi:serine/threonine protein kinase
VAIKGKSTSTFALKTYKGHSAEKTWSREVRAFEKLRDTNTTDIIGFYTAFKHGDMCNIILEYADKGTLAEFLRGTTPPSEGQEVFRLWKGIFGLMKGLHDLHNGQDIM